ncbi:hypothetical protein FKM82_029105 [Ascaphus truei]
MAAGQKQRKCPGGTRTAATGQGPADSAQTLGGPLHKGSL